MIMQDIRPNDGWLYNVSTGTTPMGTPVEITQDRFRSVFPNTTKPWTRKTAQGPGCVGTPCDFEEHQIGWGADRLTYFAEQLESKDVSTYHYRVIFKPSVIIPDVDFRG